ncbi:hypothetical protein QUF80_23610 [Desulfococcaceae bacterium HSG8]|nr:hypothetical protein [Desulfococcaceae bacterium HSG8]
MRGICQSPASAYHSASRFTHHVSQIMSEIKHKALQSYLKKHGKEAFFSVYLIYGEDLLCKTAFNNLLDALLPLPERSMNYEPVENDNIYEAIERANTFSLLPGTKVVTLLGSRIFYSKQAHVTFLEKAKEAFDNEDMKKAAKYVASLLGILNLSFGDVDTPANRSRNLNLDSELLSDDKWLDKIVTYCKDNEVSVPPAKDNAGDLQKAIEKGFPEGNHLIITTDISDKRRGLFKAINKHGMVIDCSVPRGSRMADKKEQESVLGERMRAILGQSGKKMDRDAYMAMYEMTGFDLRTFSNNLEKLINYVGSRKNISVHDVNAVLKRTKQDPIYELTSAVSDRKTEDALFFVNSLLSSGFFPLQVLGAIINQIRKLLLMKGFAESPRGKVWNTRVSYQGFQAHVMPEIRAYDDELLSRLEAWESLLSKKEEKGDGKKKKGKKKAKPVTDVLIAKNPKSPYPVYLTLLKSEKFTNTELLEIIEYLSEADLKLKTTGQNPKLVIEKAVLRICGT